MTKTPTTQTERNDDEYYIDALTHDFQTARQISLKMRRNETPRTFAEIVARMNDFVHDSDDVEREFCRSPARWRIVREPVQPAPDPEPIPVAVQPKRRTKRSSALSTKPLSKRPRAVVANDNAPIITLPAANDNRAGVELGLHQANCFEVMAKMEDQSVDLILADLPYGSTSAHLGGEHIDRPIDLERLWAEYRRIIAPRGNIVLFADRKFSNAHMNAAPDGWFISETIWRKDSTTGEKLSRYRPLLAHENILVFSPAKMTARAKLPVFFNPLAVGAVEKIATNKRRNKTEGDYLSRKLYEVGTEHKSLSNCPTSVLHFPKPKRSKKNHPFAKPVELCEYLIKLYSPEGSLILDNCLGGGSTAVAAINLNRDWIGIEQNAKAIEIAERNIAEAMKGQAA